PTQQTAAGVPTRLSFGLEEVYETTNPATGLSGVVPANPVAVGPYSAFGGGCILTLTGGARRTGGQAGGPHPPPPRPPPAAYALVDPDDSKQALAATPNGGLVVTHTGGAKPSGDPTASAYADVAPTDGLKDPQFLTPFVFDDTTPARIGLAARNIFLADSK